MPDLAIDIGNTRVKAACFKDGHLLESAIFLHEQKEYIAKWVDYHRPDRVIISSTAEADYSVDDLMPKTCTVLDLAMDTPLPINSKYQSETLGRDRIANAVAGHSKNQIASLVIDAGTCVTYDWTIDGDYLGGGISPGLHMRLRAMNEFTGRLPLVEVNEQQDLIGSDTKGSLQSGALYGLLFEMNGIISEFKGRCPDGSLLLTGGDCLLLAGILENDIFADPLLTLRGLHAILQFNNA